MYKLKSVSFYFLISLLLISFSGCEEDFLTNQRQTNSLNKITFDQGREDIGGYTDHPDGERVPYPTIQHTTYNSWKSCLSP